MNSSQTKIRTIIPLIFLAKIFILEINKIIFEARESTVFYNCHISGKYSADRYSNTKFHKIYFLYGSKGKADSHNIAIFKFNDKDKSVLTE